MRKAALTLAAATALSACRGTVPSRGEPLEQGLAAILIGARIDPPGAARDAGSVVDLESAQGLVYRLPVKAGENALYVIEPGTYRLAPARSLFGFPQETMTVAVDGRSFHPPYPAEILHGRSIEVKPRSISALGVLEVSASGTGARLDAGLSARRALVEDMIHAMMDPARPFGEREAAISWNRPLQDALLAVQAEKENLSK